MRRLERIGRKPRSHSPVFRLNRGPRPGAGVLQPLRRQRLGGEPLSARFKPQTSAYLARMTQRVGWKNAQTPEPPQR